MSDRNVKSPGGAYDQAGVGLDRADQAVDRIRDLLASRVTQADGVSSIGKFAGGYHLGEGVTLLAGADGVGTKILVAKAMGHSRDLGIDLVAMNVNDVLASGGRPLFFLDYIAASHLEVELVASLVEGMLDGCDQAGCLLLGGETAEMPGMYGSGDYDLAGFSVGVQVHQERSSEVGDVVVGILSQDFHSNGFSLVRKIVDDAHLDYHARYPQIDHHVLGNRLLAPTPIYVRPVLAALNRFGDDIKSMAHITGGGLVGNLPRALSPSVGVELDRDAWDLPPLLSWFQELAGLSFEEMVSSFNGGIGFALVVRADAKSRIIAELSRHQLSVRPIGRVVSAPGVHWT